MPPFEAQVQNRVLFLIYDYSKQMLKKQCVKNLNVRTFLWQILIYAFARQILPKKVDGEARSQLPTPWSGPYFILKYFSKVAYEIIFKLKKHQNSLINF